MHLIRKIYRGCGEKVRHNNNNGKEWSLVSVLLTVYLIYLNSVVSADQSDWKSVVPKRNHTTPPLAPVYKPGGASQGKDVQPHYLQHHQHHPHQHLQQNFNSKVIATASASSSRTLSTSRYSSHPTYSRRMGFIFADSTPSTSATLLPEASPSFQTFAPKLESLSSLPSASPSTTFSTTITSINSSSPNTNVVSAAKNSLDKKMQSKRKNKRKENKTAKAYDTNASLTNNSVRPEKVQTISANTELQTGTGRTLLMTPLMAYLFPVFIAQLFGMGMIPAAALLTLPIFLLPFGLAAGVFLV